MSAQREDDPSRAALRAYLAQSMRDSYLRALSESDGLLKMGLRDIENGVLFIERAFNLKNSPDCPYTFPDDVRACGHKLLVEIFSLWKNNKQRMQLRTGALVDSDQGFQRLMSRALEPVKPRRKSKP